MSDDADAFVLDREIGCTRAEFLRWLPGATRHARMQLTADRAVVHTGDTTVEISFAEAPPRSIGRVCVPVLKASFRFSGAGTDAYRDFMAYFDLYTSRGGG